MGGWRDGDFRPDMEVQSFFFKVRNSPEFGRPGLGTWREFIQAIVELKQRNPRFGYRRIAQQIAKACGQLYQFPAY